MQAEILSVGAEMVSGAQVDTNSAWLSEQLLRRGVVTCRHTTVGDKLADIAAALGEAAARCNLVVITGGLGPTQDDLTREALAEVAQALLVMHEPSREAVAAYFVRSGRPVPESNRKQAMLPAGAAPLPNAWGTAPGVRMTVGQAEVFALPGVPREMKAMFDAYLVPFVQAAPGLPTIAECILRTFGEGESALAEQLTDLMTPGRNPHVGTTASGGTIAVRITARADDPLSADTLARRDADTVRRRLGTLVFGEEDDTLAHAVVRGLVERQRTVATAESCTGGLIGKYLTDVAGSSAAYLGGFVTYSNARKIASLGVSQALLESCGAVSEPVARAMAEGCRAAVGSDYALSVTGIAGPDGGSADKPVGLVHIALATDGSTEHRECRFNPTLGRKVIRDRAAKTALNLLRLTLGRQA